MYNYYFSLQYKRSTVKMRYKSFCNVQLLFLSSVHEKYGKDAVQEFLLCTITISLFSTREVR